jgi:hypothetical protein
MFAASQGRAIPHAKESESKDGNASMDEEEELPASVFLRSGSKRGSSVAFGGEEEDQEDEPIIRRPRSKKSKN